MLVGPVLYYDIVCTARRSRYFISRSAYLGMLAVILGWMYAIWMMRFRDQVIPPAEFALFAEWFFYVYLAVQFVIVLLVTPAYTAGAIAEEKERRTMEFLLATDLRNRELVLGKLVARTGNLLLLLIAGLPILTLVQLIGGIDPDLLLGVFAATVLTLVALASLSILCSVYTRRARDAIMLTYFAALFYWAASAALLTLLTYAHIRDFVLVAGAKPYLLEDLLWYVNIGNPFVMIGRLIYELQGGVSVTTCLFNFLRDYGGFCVALTLICCTWAVLRVRALALRHAQGGTPRVRRNPRHWGRPRVGNDAMLWKEIFEPGLRFGSLGRVISLLVIIFVLAPVSAILIDLASYSKTQFFGYNDPLVVWIAGLVAAAATFMLLGVAVRAAGSLSGERDILTLDGLLTTPLSSNSILFAKWLGAIAGTRWAWCLLLATWGLGVYCAKLELLAFPLLLLVWFIYAAFVAQLGLWFSLISPTTLRATLRTLLMAFGLGLGHWLLWLYYLPLYLHLDDRDLDPVLLKDIHLGLTPPAVLTMVTFESHWSEARFASKEFWQSAVFACFGLGVTAAATVILFFRTRARFRGMCARTPFLQPERSLEAEARTPASSPPVLRFPRLPRRRAVLVTAFILAPIALLWAVYYYAITLSDRRLAQAIAAIEATDPHWKFWDIEAHRKEYPVEENGALHAIAARRMIPGNWPAYPKIANGELTGGFGPARNKALDEYVAVPPEQQLDYWQANDLRDALDKVTAAREASRALVNYPGGRIPVIWASDIISTLLPDVQGMRGLANLLQFDAKLRAQEGDADGALLSVRATLHVGRAIGDEQLMISQLVRIAIQSVALKSMERVLAQGEPSEASLKELQDLLEDEVQQRLWIACLRGERAAFHEIMEQTRMGTLNPATLGVGGAPAGVVIILTGRTSHLIGLRLYQSMFEATSLPLHEQGNKLKQFEMELKASLPMNRPRAPLAYLLLPATQNVFEATRRAQANLRSAIVVLAAERYRRQLGRWPESLEALVPQYVHEIPLDPYTGRPPIMKRLDDGLVIYTVGEDGIDNGGNLDDNPKKPGSDLGYRLWEVDKRRQPPRNPEMGPPAMPPDKP